MSLPDNPDNRAPTLPQVFEGRVYENVGKYARQATMYAFHQMGGPDALAEWAEDNKGEFYTKLFPKIIAKESEVRVSRDIDGLMDVIDAEYTVEDAELSEAREDTPAISAPDFEVAVDEYEDME